MPASSSAVRPSNPFGIVSFILGLLGICSCCFPGIGLGLSGLGLFFGVLGFLNCFTRRDMPAGFAILGLLVSLVGCGPYILLALGIYGAVKNAPASNEPPAAFSPSAPAPSKPQTSAPLAQKIVPTDDLSHFLAKYGRPEEATSSENEKPRPVIITRFLTYRSRNVRAIYYRIEDGSWKLLGFTDPRNNESIDPEEVVRRMGPEAGNGVEVSSITWSEYPSTPEYERYLSDREKSGRNQPKARQGDKNIERETESPEEVQRKAKLAREEERKQIEKREAELKTEQAEKQEAAALLRLNAARLYLRDKKLGFNAKSSDLAKTKLSEIIEKFPGTKAAAQAKKLFDELGDQ
jgi:hypothetical protein